MNNDELLPARMVNEFVYCPRLFYLEWVQGRFADNDDTRIGQQVHKRVDQEAGTDNACTIRCFFATYRKASWPNWNQLPPTQ